MVESDLLDGLDDGWEWVRDRITELAGDRGEWSGYPIPDDVCPLVIEPRHPLHATLDGSLLVHEKPADKEDKEEHDNGIEVVNHWNDYNRGRAVFMLKKDGKIFATKPARYASTKRAGMIVKTLGASRQWSVQAELTAMARLKTLVTPVAFRYYFLTGTFIESSERSQVFYLFRRCRPTLAFKGMTEDSNCTLLAALCLHPIGYYEGTYAGCMVPTDDVIAHLVMMRGDERKFWSKCNQHDCRAAEAGV